MNIRKKQPPSAVFPSPSGGDAFGGGKKKIGAPLAPQIDLNLPQGHEDSEYVLSFEIEQQEGGFYSARPDTQNHPLPY